MHVDCTLPGSNTRGNSRAIRRLSPCLVYTVPLPPCNSNTARVTFARQQAQTSAASHSGRIKNRREATSSPFRPPPTHPPTHLPVLVITTAKRVRPQSLRSDSIPDGISVCARADPASKGGARGRAFVVNPVFGRALTKTLLI